MFVGRRDELKTLEDAYAGSESAFIPIYGRRRVGKSELILRFLDKRPGVYFLGKAAPAALQIREFLTEASRALDVPLLASMRADGWKDALLAVTSEWKNPEKLVLALDEFQWMAGASPELPSVLQECWDRRWNKSGNVMVILCGSLVGFMEREVLGKKSPLFGRRTRQILLKPFGYLEAAEFHPSWSVVDRAEAYFLCGGVPLYHRFLDADASLEENIERHVLDEHAPMYREPDFLLREELRDVESYFAVLMALAEAHATQQGIAKHAGIPERSIHYYLQQLVELGYIRRRYPLTGARPVKRHVRFVLADALLRFWFRFVFPNLSFLAEMGPRRTLRERIRPALPAFYGSCFEGLSREALAHLYRIEGVSAGFEIGEYWSKQAQIDVVGFRDDGWTDIGECKWGPVRSANRVVRELSSKVAAYPNKRGATIGRRAFVRSNPGGASRDPEVRWHSLEEMYETLA